MSPNANIYFPKKSHHGYFDKAMQRWFNSKSEKRNYMNSHKLVEDGSMERDKKRVSRIVEEINEDRRKKGLKTRTVEQYLGDSRR